MHIGSVSFPLLVHVLRASNLLHERSRHLITVFQHTLWLAPLTAFGNVCLLSLASLHLEHAPEKRPDLCAVEPLVISCTSALLCPERIFQLSVLCHREARAVISPSDSLTITPVRFPKVIYLPDVSVFLLLFIPSCLPELVCNVLLIVYIDY